MATKNSKTDDKSHATQAHGNVSFSNGSGELARVLTKSREITHCSLYFASDGGFSVVFGASPNRDWAGALLGFGGSFTAGFSPAGGPVELLARDVTRAEALEKLIAKLAEVAS